MEAALLAVWCCALLACSSRAFSLTQEHGSGHGGVDKAGSGHANLSSHHRHVRYPLYMMQLYRSFKSVDSPATPWAGAVDASGTSGDRPSADKPDSVLSLMAKGEFKVKVCLFVP